MSQILILSLIKLTSDHHPSGNINVSVNLDGETKTTSINIPEAFPAGVIVAAQTNFSNDKIKVGDQVTVNANGQEIGSGKVEYAPYGVTMVNCNL